MPKLVATLPRNGLTGAEASARLAVDGPNELAVDGSRSLFAILANVLREPMLALLVAAGVVYLLLGDVHDALVLVAFVGISVGITVAQEGRAERALETLRELSLPEALVIRDGVRRRIPSRQLVCGDLLVIAEGDRIPADGWLVEAESLQIDESILTGESISVHKQVLREGEAEAVPTAGGDSLPYVFSGTLAVRGNGLVRIAATGLRSAMGKIGLSLASLETEAPRLTAQTRRLVLWFAFFGLGTSLLATLLYGWLRGGWLEAVLAGIALAMSMLPEELPVVLALFMTIGTLRMSRARVLTRRGSAIESLGAATVLCTDKTGTLTQNRMEIAELRLPDGSLFAPGSDVSLTLPAAFIELAGLGILASKQQPFDPMETAFHDLGARHRGSKLNWRQGEGWALHREYTLSPEMMAVSHAWKGESESEHLVAAKGAPEAIADLCHMALEERQAMDSAVVAMARRGLRVLGVAEARWSEGALPETQHHFDFVYRGLVGLADPIRDTVPDAVRQLQDAGIRIVMITGDYPVTADAIAAQAGIRHGLVMTGAQLAALDEAQLAAQVHEVAVFARVLPDQKLRIVEALKAAGEIVAMTGDGVNDAPSLKAAHIGIAMGKRGTDVAREASAIVLLDDDFGSIPAAVRLGRRIYDNLRKAMGFIFAVHIPIGGLALAPLLAGWPIILGPMHIALLEMVIDPVCSLAFEAEPEEQDVMTRPPRNPDARLFPPRLLIWSLVQGAVAAALLIALVVWTHGNSAISVPAMRSTAFVGLVSAVLVLVWLNRTFNAAGRVSGKRRNLPLAIIVTLVLVVLALLFGTPLGASLFGFALLDLEELAAITGLALILAVVLGLLKRGFRESQAG